MHWGGKAAARTHKPKTELHVDELFIQHSQARPLFFFSLPPKCQLLHIYTSGEKLTTHIFRAFLKVITLISESLDLPDLITSGSRVIIFERFVYEGDVFWAPQGFIQFHYSQKAMQASAGMHIMLNQWPKLSFTGKRNALQQEIARVPSCGCKLLRPASSLVNKTLTPFITLLTLTF